METLQRTANRGSISTASYDVDNSVSLQTAGVNSEFFNYTISSAGSRTKGTVSMWIKRSSLGTVQYLWEQGNTDNETGRIFARFAADDTLRIATGSTVLRNTNRVFRDIAAWYHIVVAVDTTSGTADNRTRLYVNGVEETSFSTKNNFSQNDNTGMNFEKQYIGLSVSDSSAYQSFNGYMAEVFGADGLVYAASDFGEFDSSGIWKPIDITGLSVGTNGFLMKFENAGSMGAATTGHGFSVQNINQHDQATDVPSNNFATLNPLMANAGTANYLTQIRGNTYAYNEANAYKIANSTFGVTSGKWYWEVKATDVNGVTAIGVTMPYYWDTDYTLGGCVYYAQGAQRYNNSSAGSFGATYTDGDIISFALDMNATPPTMTVYKNNVSQGNIFNGLSINGAGGAFLPPKEDGYFPKVVGYGNNIFECNFGGFRPTYIDSSESDDNGYGSFAYEPPSGFYSICTKNLAEFGG